MIDTKKLMQLKELYDQGILTKEEYEKEKALILADKSTDRPVYTRQNATVASSQGDIFHKPYTINESASASAQYDFQKLMQEHGLYSEESKESDLRTEACLFAQAVALQTLKAPASAVFCDLNEMSVNEQSNGTLKVRGYVNAQNSYGALIKTYFSYDVVKESDGWKCCNVFVPTVAKQTHGWVIFLIIFFGLDILGGLIWVLIELI